MSIHLSYMFNQSSYGRLISLLIAHWKTLGALDGQEIAFTSLNYILQPFQFFLVLPSKGKSLFLKIAVSTFWKYCIFLSSLACKSDLLSYLNMIALYCIPKLWITLLLNFKNRYTGVANWKMNSHVLISLFAFQISWTLSHLWHRDIRRKREPIWKEGLTIFFIIHKVQETLIYSECLFLLCMDCLAYSTQEQFLIQVLNKYWWMNEWINSKIICKKFYIMFIIILLLLKAFISNIVFNWCVYI